MAECGLGISGTHVGLSQKKVTSRVSGMSGASDREGATFFDGYLVGAVNHHGVRGCQRDAGSLQFHCRKETESVNIHML